MPRRVWCCYNCGTWFHGGNTPDENTSCGVCNTTGRIKVATITGNEPTYYDLPTKKDNENESLSGRSKTHAGWFRVLLEKLW